MTTDQHTGEHGAEVVPIPKGEPVPAAEVDAGTARPTRAPLYADISPAGGGRRPIVPHRWRGRENIRRTLGGIAERRWYAARYHGLRSPRYLAESLLWAGYGVLVLAAVQMRWWWVAEAHPLKSEAVARGDSREWHKLHRETRQTRKARGIALAGELAAVTLALVALTAYAPWWAWAAFAAAAVPVLAHIGRPEDRPIIAAAVLPARMEAPTQDVILRALSHLGIGELNRAFRDGEPPQFPSPVREDGPGWRAEIDLPHGVTAAMVLDRRAQLASGLRRPLGAVWPEPVTTEHEARLDLFVGRHDVATTPPQAGPLLRGAAVDVFAPVPFGTDVRGRQVKVPIIYHNYLIGAIPRQGKTAAVRGLSCAAALDPIAEKWDHELKGSGDLDPLEKVCHRYVSGIHDEAIAYTAESLRLLRAEVQRRTDRLKALPRELCPDKRVTRAIAMKRSHRLWPIICTIDEAQNLFAHPLYGKQAAEDAEFIIKIGPAFGVVLIIATQRPDKASVPTGVTGNVSMRFCLKVMGQLENDMILGTSAYKNGIKATTFRPEIDAGIGYLVGLTAPLVVRTYYLDMGATERIAARARRLREDAGTLTGIALDAEGEAGPRDVLADVLAALGDDGGLHWQPLADRLAQRFPDRWAEATGDAVRAECARLGVASVDVRYPPGRSGTKLKGCRRDLVERAIRR